MECKICKKIFSGSGNNPENFSRHVEACEKAQKKKYEKDDKKKSTSMKSKKNQYSIMSFMIKKPAFESDKSCLETLIVNEETDTEEPGMCNNNEFDMNQDTVLETSVEQILNDEVEEMVDCIFPYSEKAVVTQW